MQEGDIVISGLMCERGYEFPLRRRVLQAPSSLQCLISLLFKFRKAFI